MLEARDEKALHRFKRQLARKDLVVVDEFGYVPFSKTGAELLFEFFAERYERGSVVVTTNLPFDQWTEVLGSERLTGTLLDRLTHRVHILEMNGESYRFKDSVRLLAKKTPRQHPTDTPTQKPNKKRKKTRRTTLTAFAQRVNLTFGWYTFPPPLGTLLLRRLQAAGERPHDGRTEDR